MKKLISAVLALTMMLCLVACGGNGGGSANKEAPNLQKYYDDFMASLGADNAPMMMPVEGEALDAFYAGLSGIAVKQSVIQMAAIGAVAFELALVECENAADVETVKGIFEARVDAQVNGGAFYPETTAAWEKAEVIVNGNVVALIVAGAQQADAVTAFNALFA